MQSRSIPPRSTTKVLSPAESAALRRLNAYLAELENLIVKEAIAADRAMQARKHDPADPMNDYELEAVITYHLRQDDPEYRSDDDNILAEQTEYLTGISLDAGGRLRTLLADGQNHNDHPEGETHCWLYHDLYDHRNLDWADMLRIGLVWLDIKVAQQYYTAVSLEYACWGGSELDAICVG
ncbi:hypothetical protein [Methylococcus capsulatus]|uniref:hypothetical protein n=1 Tax=Methylococcus capsulatus TaxID=414 RepID=UPI001C52CDD6|nr:hypothetical protein [Methylococcus capsulatus]QXP90933.1 hypothetical protein KW114_01850 [Methylococcus capsulatus]